MFKTNSIFAFALFAAVMLPSGAPGQEAEAHYAQYLITTTMAAHPELQKMGIHVTPPGGRDELIVACTVPSKIGKKSSPSDLKVEHTGKPSVKTVTEQSFYDLAFPLSDSKGQPIGMIVMEMRFSGAASADDSITKAQAITNGIERQIASRDALFGPAPSNAHHTP